MANNLEATDSGNLIFKKARIYSNCTKGSDMLRVRILPDMEGLEEDLLPYYAPFSPCTIIKGASELELKSSNKATAATVVWCVCTTDFKVGWILFEANSQYGIEDTQVSSPWGFDSFKTQLERMQIVTNADYSELRVNLTTAPISDTFLSAGVTTTATEGGTVGSVKKGTAASLDVVNVRTGERCIMLQAGTCLFLGQGEIFLRVGNPGQESNQGSDRASTIHMTTDTIDFKAKYIKFHPGAFIKLGDLTSAHIPIMYGASTAVDGTPFVTSNFFLG